MKLRSHLLVLTLGTLLPMIVFAVVTAVVFAQRERLTFQRGATERTLALLTAVDTELRRSVAALQALATSEHLDTGDLGAFHAEAARVLSSQPDWLTINLAPPSAQQVVNLVRPLGADLPPINEWPSFDRVLRTAQPAASNLFYEPLTAQYVFAVRAPVVRDGVTRYVLSALVKPHAISALLAVQRLPPAWVGVVLDGENRIVARTVESERTLGQLASDSLRAALARGSEGWFHGSTIEGDEVYTPYNRSAWSGWTVAMGIPAAAVEAGAWRTTAAMAAGLVSAAVLAVLLALGLGRRITAPIVALAAAAKAIGRGVRPHAPPLTRVEEVGEVGRALENAAAAVREREATLRESEARFSALVEGVPQLVWIAALSGEVEHFNQRWYEYTGTTPGQSLGHGWAQVLDPGDRDRVWERWRQTLRSGEPVELEYRLRGSDGQYRWFLARGVPFRGAGGEILKWFGTCTDIEEQKRAEERLRSADRAKDEFLAMLGHELRNPLGAIAGAVSVLNAVGKGGETEERARAAIDRQVHHLSRLVDDLLDVSRVTTGKVALSPQPLDLGDLVDNALSGWRAAGRLNQHQVSVEVSPVWVDADATRLEQVLANLVGNALKYTPTGGEVAVRVERDGDTAVLEVADSGVGIPAGLIDTVFEPFVQGGRALDRAQGGLGLGLTLVKSLVGLHRGTVQAHSAGPGKGSVFTVRLPRVAPVERPRGVPPPSAAEGVRRRILVIEDNEDAREMLRILLTLAGHDVYEAADGPTGIELARRHAPDVALIDVGLPGLDGYEVARRIRAGEGGAASRLIAITGYGQAEDRQRALAAGFDAHLTKPVAPERLSAIIEEGIAREKGEGTRR